MNFATLPPELNSARIFAGAGPGPLLSAAASWNGLAAELDAAASSFAAVTSGLAGTAWQGAAMQAMMRAAAPYVAWLTTAATQAAVTATRAQLAAEAFEAAQAAIVHPAMVAANRSGLVSLVAGNLFGQNAPAIAAAEAGYEQMWAHDVAVMAGYHAGASAAAGELGGLPSNLRRLLGELAATLNFGDCGLPPGPTLIDLNQVGSGAKAALLMGGTGTNPLPWNGFAPFAETFITPSHSSYSAQFLVTPSKMFPLTGLDSMTFNASVAEGMHRLNTAIMDLHAAGRDTIVFGLSQSSTVATMEMRYLQSLPIGVRPDVDELSFVLTANPNRPNGGLLARFPGFSIPFIDFTFNGATPANAYPTIDYAIQYDGAADFPKYPLNPFATVNALMGFAYIHPSYALTPAQFASGLVQPVSPDSLTTYILIPTHNLPMLNPLRAVPLLGNPLADLVQPDLRVLVELGYDRTGYQDVPTPFALFPQVDPGLVLSRLGQGTAQGFTDALADLGLLR